MFNVELGDRKCEFPGLIGALLYLDKDIGLELVLEDLKRDDFFLWPWLTLSSSLVVVKLK